MVSVTATSPTHWKYVSEGGASIVFSYIGPPHPQFNGTVLRLRKTAVAPLVDIPEETDGVGEPDDPSIEYQKRCLQRLIPAEHLPRLESVELTSSWLKELSELHDDERPELRRSHDCIDARRHKGVLATDLVGGDWVAVEIKPKWGFLPSPKHLSNTTRTVKTQTCRFCMHAHMKSGQGDAVSLGYCPLDLYSGENQRMIKAIHALWDSWVRTNGSVNSLKIFMNGAQVHPSEAYKMFPSSSADLVGDEMRDAFTNALLPLLLRTPVLPLLSRLQRNLDPLDIEGLSELWHNTEMLLRDMEPHSTPNDPPTSPLGVSSPLLPAIEPTIDDWSDFIDGFLSNTNLDHDNPSSDDLRHYLLAYLLSATFKDCSLIVRLDYLQRRPVYELQSPRVEPSCVKIIDLDLKPLSRLRKWEKLDHNIVMTYSSSESSQQTRCIDNGREQSAPFSNRYALYCVVLLTATVALFYRSVVM